MVITHVGKKVLVVVSTFFSKRLLSKQLANRSAVSGPPPRPPQKTSWHGLSEQF